MLNLPKIRFLGTHRSSRTEALNQRLRRTGLWNVFNPSIVAVAGGVAVAFRAGRWPGDKPFRAYYLPPDDSCETLIDLTGTFALAGSAHICDPKLLKLDNEIWVTFNTGHFEKPNRIFIAQLHPSLSDPYELILSDRNQIEKNWALFRRNGTLYAVYSVQPLVILRALDRRSTARTIEFERVQDDAAGATVGQGSLTLGSQLVALDSCASEYGAIVHWKLHVGKKRTYIGLPARIRRNGDILVANIGNTYLIHSFRALFGGSILHNPNLLSCTYVSGITIADDCALISYGINDIDAGFAEIPVRKVGFNMGA